MSSIIGLDVGDINVGVAIGHLAPATCRPYTTLLRHNGTAERDILKLAEELKADLIVVGLPLNDDNSKNEQCYKIEKFCRRLQRRSKVMIAFVDEYASSVEASEILTKNCRKGKSRRLKDVDSLAACLILKKYLDEPESRIKV